jgi:hypothetical protein
MTGLIQQSNRGYFQTTILLHQMNENPVPETPNTYQIDDYVTYHQHLSR